jgi:hypothetical protein
MDAATQAISKEMVRVLRTGTSRRLRVSGGIDWAGWYAG